MKVIEAVGSSVNIRVSRNIPFNYCYSGLMGLRLDWAVWMLFLSYRGIGLFEIGLIESVSQLSSLVFGAPAGAVSDILGRRASALLSIVSRAAAFIVILLAHDFWLFALGFALSALSQVLYNATYESITYDTCRISGRERDYKKILGNVMVIVFVASALGVAASGFVAERSFEYVYVVTLVFTLAALVPALLFKDTTGILRQKKERPGIVKHFTDAVAVVKKTPVLAHMLALGITIYVIDNTVYMYLQRYFTDIGVSLALLGLIFSADQIFVAAGSKLSFLLDHFNVKKVIAAVPLVLVVSYALMATVNSVVSAVFLFVVALVVSMFYPVQSEINNARIPAESRATLLAFKGQLSSLGIMVVFPAVGLLAEKTSLSTALLVFVLAALPLLLFFISRIYGMDLSKPV